MVELNDDIGEEKRIELWKMLLKLRLVEKKAYDLFLENLIKGTSHLSLGQEAIGSAFGVALQKDNKNSEQHNFWIDFFFRGVGAPFFFCLGSPRHFVFGVRRGAAAATPAPWPPPPFTLTLTLLAL